MITLAFSFVIVVRQYRGSKSRFGNLKKNSISSHLKVISVLNAIFDAHLKVVFVAFKDGILDTVHYNCSIPT